MSADAVLFNIELNLGAQTMEAKARVPKAPMRPADLLPILFAFDDALIGVAMSGAKEQGKAISCGAGCGACCRQLVPVSEHEALYLSELVEAMSPERQASIRDRFRDALAQLEKHGILERLRSAPAELNTLDDRRKLGIEYFQLGIPCPFLEDERCSIYVERPAICREYLVTSPAVNCRDPRPDNIEKVGLPVKFAEILYAFQNEHRRWVPLVVALEWAAQRRQTPQPTTPGVDLFRDFLQYVGPASK